jgi:hypothetical protein
MPNLRFPAATTLATPTVNTNAPGENAVVTVRAQLGEKGKYTFIFEKPTSNEMSREQGRSSRVSMQKGTRIGTRANCGALEADARLRLRQEDHPESVGQGRGDSEHGCSCWVICRPRRP